MAVASPAAVVSSASEIPGATARRLAAPAAPNPENASMMPHTVPKRPMNGATEPVVASHDMPFSTRRTSSAEATCMYAVTACKLFNFGGCGLVGCPPTWLCNSRKPAAYTEANGEPAEASACGLATPRVARKMRRNCSLWLRMRLNKPTFCRIMAHEIIEKRRSKIRTPRATKPVLARMLPRSIKRTAASTKIVLSPQFQRKFLPLQHRSTRVPRNQSKLAERCCRFDGLNVPRRAAQRSCIPRFLPGVLRAHPRKALLRPVLDSLWKMAETFDISLDSLAGRSVAPQNVAVPGTVAAPYSGATFFLETFGCQMNDHDSEKVAGLLLSRGYKQVESPDAASLVLYNTCSIREKAAQKVFSRLGEYRTKQAAGQVIGVLGCVAQQEGEEIFERAPWVSLVCGSASYRKLPELLEQVEAGNQRVTGLDNDTDETFETPVTRRDNPWRAYLTIIEGCDKACAYCVVPFTRGPERSRASDAVLKEVRELAGLGYSEVQLLGQTVNSYADPSSRRMRFSELLLAVADVPGIRRVRFTTSHPRDFGPDIVAAIETQPKLCNHVHLPVQSGSTKVLREMVRTYTRAQYLEKIAMLRAAKRSIAITTDVIVGFPGETEADFGETLSLLQEVRYDSLFSFKYSPRPNTPSLSK